MKREPVISCSAVSNIKTDRPPQKIGCREQAGFTLTELLLAASLMAFLVFVVLVFTGNIMNSWNRGKSDLTLNNEGSRALEFIVEDLENLVFRIDGNDWLVYQEFSPVAMDLPRGSLTFFSECISTTANNNGHSSQKSLSALSYWLEFRNPVHPASAEGKMYGLYRYVLSPEDSWTRARGNLTDFVESGKLREIETQPVSNNLAYFLSNKTVGFKIRFFDDVGVEMQKGVPVKHFPDENGNFPALLEVSLTVISNEGVQLLNGLELGDLEGIDSNTIRDLHSRTFSRKVILRSRSGAM